MLVILSDAQSFIGVPYIVSSDMKGEQAVLLDFCIMLVIWKIIQFYWTCEW